VELRSLAGRIAELLPARELVIFGGAAHAMLPQGSPASGSAPADALRSGHALAGEVAGEVAAAAQALNLDEFWAHVDTLVPAAPGWRRYRPAQGAAAASHRGLRPHGVTPTEGTTT
jgi:hypothetical protein